MLGVVVSADVDPCPISTTDWGTLALIAGRQPNDFSGADACYATPGMKPCAASFGLGTSVLYSTGVCLPASCNDTQLLESASVKGFMQVQFSFPLNIVPGSWYVFTCTTPGSLGGGDWDARSITMLVACGVVVAVAVGCTLAVYMRESLIDLKADLEAPENSGNEMQPSADGDLESPGSATSGSPLKQPLLPGERSSLLEGKRSVSTGSGRGVSKPHSQLWEVVKCWDLVHNTGRMFATSGDRNKETAALNGIRGISMGLVILGHTVLFRNFFLLNATEFNEHASRVWTFQIIPSAEFSVDSFFMMSGFLVTLGILRRFKSGKSLNIPLLYLHRYLRLTPAYMFALFFFTYVVPHFSWGPYWDMPQQRQMCQSQWWKNLLYIQNLTQDSTGDQCFGWAWYLSNDMMFFLISPLYLLAYKWRPLVGVAAIVATITASVIATTVYSAKEDIFSLIDLSGTKNWGNSDVMYIRPWHRIGPYLCGMLAAMAWFRYREAILASGRRHTLTFAKPVLVRCAAHVTLLGIMLAIFYSPANMYATEVPEWSKSRLVAYTGFTRTAWGAGLAALSLLWFSAPRNWISRLLSASFWEVIARLTYGAYIMHPIVLFVIVWDNTQMLRYTRIQIGAAFAGAWFLSYACAAVLFLFVEKPCMQLEALLFKRIGAGGGGSE